MRRIVGIFLITIQGRFLRTNPFGSCSRMLTEEQRDQIIKDFIDVFQLYYGEEWKRKLTSPLKPSPILQIAHQRQVSIAEVRKIRSQIILCGQFIELYMSLISPHNPQ